MSFYEWSRERLWWCPVLLAVTFVGCGKSPDATNSGTDGQGSETASSTEAGQKIIPIRRNVKDVEGNWVMVVTGQGRDNYLWIVRLDKDAKGQSQCEMIDASNDSLAPVIESGRIDGKSVHLTIKNKVATIDFEGEFDGIAVRGTLGNGPQEVYVGRLLPTDATKLSDYVPSALPPAADVFREAILGMKNQPQPRVILDLARQHRTSPIALEAVFGLLTLHARAGFDDATVLDIIRQYVDLAKVWGPRMHRHAELMIAQQLVSTARLPSEALKHLDEAERLLGDRAEPLQPQIRMLRDQAGIQVSLVKSHSSSKEDRAAAHGELQAALKKQPYNWEILLALAEYCAADKQLEEAIGYYSPLVALPLLEQFVLARRAGQPAGDPTPTDQLTRLWTERHGNADGLQAHLKTLYQERLTALKEEIKKPMPAVAESETGDHTVLVEFFTGGQMPPAIATEIAMDALRETYPHSKIVTLRYHQHIPGPDGLVNQDGEDRLAYYEMAKIPGLALDGAVLDPDKTPYAGYMQASGTSYSILRSVVDPRLKASTPIRIELAATIENGDLAIDAAVSGATEEQLPSLRLRLALAEESVQAALPNGIRSHAMVVREMPGGARGIAPKKGELKFSFSMPAAELQQHVDEYLKRYEAGNKIEFPAAAKPPIRGPLYLVGWVQNDKVDTEHPQIGRAVLQTAIVPVTGALPDAPAAPETKAGSQSLTPPAPALPE